MKKIFSLLIGLSVFAVVGCNETTTATILTKPQQIEQMERSLPTSTLFKGIHQFDASTVPNKYIVKDGVCKYQLVYRENASLLEKSAVEEFIFFFKEATGLTIEAIPDTGLTHKSDQNYISLGETTLLDSSGVRYDKSQLKNDGIVIKTKGNNIYLVGGSESGVIFSVYDFMKIMFNYEQYGVDTYEIDTGLTTVRLKNFDVIDIPDIALRSNNYGFFDVGAGTYNQSMYGYRMKMYEDRGIFMMPIFKEYDINSSNAKSTNTNTYIPYDTFYKTKPNWFSNKCDSKTKEYQLCYTAHGNEEDLNELIDEVAHKIEFSLTHFDPVNYPSLNVASFTMEDNFNTCSCKACTDARKNYGSDAGAVCLFVNKVGEKVEEWMKDPANSAYAREDFHIIFFAYNAFEQAPAHFDAQKNKYVPNDPDLYLRENVGVYFAEINNCDYQQSFFAEKNKSGKEMFDAWCDISDFIYYWTYETNFKLYMYPYDSFSCFNQNMYNYICSKNIDMFFAQGQASCGRNGTTWNGLKAYLDAKLSWDSSLNQTELTDKYFDAMYKDASQEMKELYYLFRAQNMEVFEKNPNFLCLRSNYNEVNKSIYYPLNSMKAQIKKVDVALEKIQKYKIINPDLYTVLYRNIEAEAVTPLYIILDQHLSSLTLDDKQDIISRLYDDITLLSLEGKKTKEHGIALSEELAKFEDR